LSGLGASFLHQKEGGPAHMHVASVFVFEGERRRPVSCSTNVEHRLALVHRSRVLAGRVLAVVAGALRRRGRGRP